MSYRQVKDANWKIPYVGGWCEGYVEGAWGRATKPTAAKQSTSGVYASAMAAWNAEPNKHTGQPPMGITVPVYFKLGSTPYGHVAIRLDDGYVASSTLSGFHTQGYIHRNLADLIAMYGKYNQGCTYLGWGEHVGGIRAVESVVLATAAQVKQAYLDILERPADADGLAHYQKYTLDFVKKDLLASKEYAKLQAKKKAATLAAQQKAEAEAKAAAEAEAKAKAEAAAKAKAKAEAEAKAREEAEKQQASGATVSDIQNVVKQNNDLLNILVGLVKQILDKLTSIFK